jgi:hypothetical protein
MSTPAITSTAETKPPTEAHPLADIFPRLKHINPEAYKAFVEDIKERGQQEWVVTYDGKVLDGRNRMDACQELGIPLKFREYAGSDPIGFVLSANLHRRHLNEAQRAFVAAKLANLDVCANQTTKGAGTSIEAAAKALSISRASVERAKTILKKGDPSLIEAVQQRQVSLAAGAQQAQQGSSTNSGNVGTGNSGKCQDKEGGKGKGKSDKGETPSCVEVSDAYDKAERDLIAKLEDLAADEAEAAAADTIRKLNNTVRTMKKAAEKEAEKAAAAAREKVKEAA